MFSPWSVNSKWQTWNFLLKQKKTLNFSVPLCPYETFPISPPFLTLTKLLFKTAATLNSDNRFQLVPKVKTNKYIKTINKTTCYTYRYWFKVLSPLLLLIFTQISKFSTMSAGSSIEDGKLTVWYENDFNSRQLWYRMLRVQKGMAQSSKSRARHHSLHFGHRFWLPKVLLKDLVRKKQNQTTERVERMSEKSYSKS